MFLHYKQKIYEHIHLYQMLYQVLLQPCILPRIYHATMVKAVEEGLGEEQKN